MRATRTLTTLAALAALTVPAACGADESPTAEVTDGTTLPTGEDDAAVLDVCALVTEAEVSEVLGGTVTSEEVPGGGCNFSNEEDPRAASVQIVASVLDEGAGGFEGSVSGVSGVLQGDDGGALDGIGDQAYAKTGTFGDSDFVRGSGLVRLGTTVVQVDLSPNAGTAAADVKAVLVDALTLVASKA